MSTVYWFRRDLRLADNPALARAARRGLPVLPVFVLDPGDDGVAPLGAASRWWLHHSLAALDRALQGQGSRLLLLRGRAEEILPALARETGADRILANRRHEPSARAQEESLEHALRGSGVQLELGSAGLLHDPQVLRTGAGRPYRVFTPFWKALRAGFDPGPERQLPPLVAPSSFPAGEALDALGLLPGIDWAGGLREAWTPGEEGAQQRLRRFLEQGLAGYARRRDIPGDAGTSRLSPHLHWGEVGPRQLWRAAMAQADQHDPQDLDRFLAEIAWREFCAHLLVHFPDLPGRPLQPAFERFAWRPDAGLLRAWQQGCTGYPIVDAGMRELWHTGWMHNRVRMIVASFLIKDLLQPWQDGEAWFADTLVDADLASNAANWQWVAGCGADASPFFRIFNPTLQGRKFDPDGSYVRRWVPELSGLPDRHLHEPWLAPAQELERAGLVLGRHYPRPVVDHDTARRDALAALKALG